MKKILILCAREEELNAFLSLLPYSKDEEGYYHQELKGDQITLGIAGIGKVARAGSLSRYLANHHQPQVAIPTRKQYRISYSTFGSYFKPQSLRDIEYLY